MNALKRLTATCAAMVAAPLAAWGQVLTGDVLPAERPIVEQKKEWQGITIFRTARGVVARQTISNTDSRGSYTGYCIDVSPYLSTEADIQTWLRENAPKVDLTSVETWDSVHTPRKRFGHND